MKPVAFILLVLTLLNMPAQDTLVFKNGTKIISLVLLVGEDSIRYKPFKDMMGPDVYAKNEEVNSIKYKNGDFVNIDSLFTLRRIRLNIESASNSSYKWATPEKMKELGKEHAAVYYKCRFCALAWGTAGLLAGPGALIPAQMVIDKKISDKKLNYPDKELWLNEDYQASYRKKVGSIRRTQIGFAVGITSFISGMTSLWLAYYLNTSGK